MGFKRQPTVTAKGQKMIELCLVGNRIERDKSDNCLKYFQKKQYKESSIKKI